MENIHVSMCCAQLGGLALLAKNASSILEDSSCFTAVGLKRDTAFLLDDTTVAHRRHYSRTQTAQASSHSVTRH